MLPDRLEQPGLTIEHRRGGGSRYFVVYSWEVERGSSERVQREIATFCSIAEAAKAFPRAILRKSFVSRGNPVRFGPYGCPSCSSFYYTMEWHIPLVYRCSTC